MALCRLCFIPLSPFQRLHSLDGVSLRCCMIQCVECHQGTARNCGITLFDLGDKTTSPEMFVCHCKINQKIGIAKKRHPKMFVGEYKFIFFRDG